MTMQIGTNNVPSLGSLPTRDPSTKRCNRCHQTKPLEGFSSDLRSKDYLMARCRECNRTSVRSYSVRCRDKRRAATRRHKLRSYGITPEVFQFMRDRQNNTCAICLTPFGDDPKNCCIDHDHQTGAVRALLCKCCNLGLGSFRENRDAMARAITYLEWYGNVKAKVS